MRATIAALWLALVCTLLACKPEAEQATQVLLELDAEPGVRARLAQLRIQISGGGADEAYADYREASRSDLDAPVFPLQIALTPRGGDATRRYQLIATATAADGSFVAEARLLGGYVANSARFARLVLEDACADVERCTGTSEVPLTCHAGSCADPSVDARRLSTDRTRPTLVVAIAMSGEDARDASMSEASGLLEAGVGSPVGGSDAGLALDAGAVDAGAVLRDAGGGDASTVPVQGSCKLGSSKLPCRL